MATVLFCGVRRVSPAVSSSAYFQLRFRLFSAAAQLVTTGRRRYLRLAAHRPWTDVITAAADRLQALPNPD
ncbi:transposase [Streptomyces sp. NPDC058280]|uniref:transposase n=1 Tax=Streptomyces sp. NPDC058280 TaxID=3346419 RepID=UPI0036E98F18